MAFISVLGCARHELKEEGFFGAELCSCAEENVTVATDKQEHEEEIVRRCVLSFDCQCRAYFTADSIRSCMQSDTRMCVCFI
jgi:hypothetical protein